MSVKKVRQRRKNSKTKNVLFSYTFNNVDSAKIVCSINR